MSTLRVAWRRLRRSPGITLTCVLVLAVGIGANVAIYSLVDAIVLEPLPYPSADRLITLWHRAPGLGIDRFEHSDGTYLYLRDHARTLDEVGVYELTEANLSDPQGAARLTTVYATASLFDVLGARAGLGRVVSADDDRPDAEPVVVIGHRFWRERFGGDPTILGERLVINGSERTIVGVLVRGFEHPRGKADLWMPLGFDASEAVVDNFSYVAIARRSATATNEDVERELAALLPRAVETYPGIVDLAMLESGRIAPFVVPLAEEVIGDLDETLWMVLAGVGLVLLIACANVANLFLVRAEGRKREIAVRAALGARRRTLLADALAESLILAALSGMLGLALGAGAVSWLRARSAVELPRLDTVAIDGSVVAFAVGVSILAAILFGLLPALRHTARRVAAELREGGRSGAAGGRRLRARSALVVVQVALAMVLLVGAGLLLRSYGEIRAIDPGFTAGDSQSGTLLFRLSLVGERYEDSLQRVRAFDEIRRRLSALPGVEAVGLSSGAPFFEGNQNVITIEDRPSEPGLFWVHPTRAVLGDYFGALGLPLLAGERFGPDDFAGVRDAAVVSEAFATRFWGSPTAALGRRLHEGAEEQADNPLSTIVGVVANLHDEGLTANASETVYLPSRLDGVNGFRSTMTAALRTDRAPLELVPEVRSVVADFDPDLPLSRVTTLAALLERETVRAELTALLLALAAGVALALGSIGLFGVLSYLVALRRQELGIRTALGAARGQLASLILRHAMVLVGTGLALGALAALLLARTMASQLYGVSTFDPATFAGVGALLAVTGLGAAAWPTWRATATDPMTALRAE